jgi:uncharacterized protein
MNVAVLGASAKPDRYSYRAVKLLREKGHDVYPVHPTLREIEGIPVYASLGQIPVRIDTATLYLSAENQKRVVDDLLATAPRRVIFNPGTENPDLAAGLQAVGVETREACTLVLLKTGAFDA